VRLAPQPEAVRHVAHLDGQQRCQLRRHETRVLLLEALVRGPERAHGSAAQPVLQDVEMRMPAARGVETLEPSPQLKLNRRGGSQRVMRAVWRRPAVVAPRAAGIGSSEISVWS
jgi:hypothetical protein